MEVNLLVTLPWPSQITFRTRFDKATNCEHPDELQESLGLPGPVKRKLGYPGIFAAVGWSVVQV